MEISNGHNQEQMALITPSNFPQQQQNSNTKYQQNQVAPNSCPRCDSTNTKFCYYNNYSLSQPRYFCKACRRYWTKGGILRNVPVGGGCRKNKKPSSSTTSPNSSLPSFKHHKTSITTTTKPPSEISMPADDLTLAFNPFLLDQNPKTLNSNPTFLDILRGGGLVGPAHQSLCYNGIGFGGGGNDQQRVLPVTFHGGSSDRTMMQPGMAVRDDDDDVGGNDHDIVGRDYWNDCGSVSSTSSTWHGLVNSSFL